MISKDIPNLAIKQRIVLEYARDDEVDLINDNPFEKEKNRVRKLLLGSCKLLDTKLEKNGAYEITAAVIFTYKINDLFIER